MSSQTGITARTQQVYLTDTDSYLWALNRKTGNVTWRQEQLKARRLTTPAIIGKSVVVGDAEGYLHWLDRKDGHFMARAKVNNSPIQSAPLISHGTVYVMTQNGQLSAYQTS